MDLQERWEANEARKAYAAAFAQFQANVPTIVRRKTAQVGSGTYQYAPLSDIAEQIRDTLREAELNYRFRVQDDGDTITVTCIVSHVLGHSEETSMSGSPDTSGAKNEIQMRGSTVSYLQRYTLVGALGLTSADSDMDGRLQPEHITDDQVAELEEEIKQAGVDVKKFLAFMKVDSLGEIRAVDYGKADRTLRDFGKAKQKPAEKTRTEKPASSDQEGAS